MTITVLLVLGWNSFFTRFDAFVLSIPFKPLTHL
jgi:hypothetical protein